MLLTISVGESIRSMVSKADRPIIRRGCGRLNSLSPAEKNERLSELHGKLRHRSNNGGKLKRKAGKPSLPMARCSLRGYSVLGNSETIVFRFSVSASFLQRFAKF